MYTENVLDELFGSTLGLTLPNQRFFIPKESFWDTLKTVNCNIFIDCGTGTGELLNEATENGVKMSGCDVAHRQGMNKEVHQISALDMPMQEGVTMLVCRPDHGGWFERLAIKALKNDARVLYVGLPRNLEIDIPETFKVKELAKDVGQEGEVMLEIIEAKDYV